MKTTITTILAILLLSITPSLAVANDGTTPNIPEGANPNEEQEFITDFSSTLPGASQAPTPNPVAPSVSEEGVVDCSALVGQFLQPISYDKNAVQYNDWGKKIKKQLTTNYNVDGRMVKG